MLAALASSCSSSLTDHQRGQRQHQGGAGPDDGGISREHRRRALAAQQQRQGGEAGGDQAQRRADLGCRVGAAGRAACLWWQHLVRLQVQRVTAAAASASAAAAPSPETLAARGCPAPSRCPTRAHTAKASPKGIMKTAGRWRRGSRGAGRALHRQQGHVQQGRVCKRPNRPSLLSPAAAQARTDRLDVVCRGCGRGEGPTGHTGQGGNPATGGNGPGCMQCILKALPQTKPHSHTMPDAATGTSG